MSDPDKNEIIVRDSYNSKHSCNARKEILDIGDQGAKHEFDLYEEGKVIGGISTSPWKNKTKKNLIIQQVRIGFRLNYYG